MCTWQNYLGLVLLLINTRAKRVSNFSQKKKMKFNYLYSIFQSKICIFKRGLRFSSCWGYLVIFFLSFDLGIWYLGCVLVIPRPIFWTNFEPILSRFLTKTRPFLDLAGRIFFPDDQNLIPSNFYFMRWVKIPNGFGARDEKPIENGNFWGQNWFFWESLSFDEIFLRISKSWWYYISWPW